MHVLTRPEQVAEFWQWLTDRTCGWVAADTETGSPDHPGQELEWWQPGFTVRLFQFGDAGGGWAIPYEGWPRLVEAALNWCSMSRTLVIWHNLAYDWQALMVVGIELDLSNVVDTFVLASLGNYAEESRALKPCAIKALGSWAGAGQHRLQKGMKNANWTWTDVPMNWRPYPFYAVLDTCLTGLLWEAWQDRYKRWESQHDLEISAIGITAGMARRGLPVDRGYMFKTLEQVTAEETEILDRLAGYGVKNPAQNASVSLALQKAGAQMPGLTATGKVAVDGDTLALIDHEIARDVVKYREVHRIRKTYLGAMLEAAGGEVEGIGLIHPNIKSLEAKTSRMSISDPPLQQLPRDNPIVRNAVVPRTEDERILSADFGQIEMRLFAAMNKDAALLALFNEADETKTDFFVTIGKRLYKDPNFKKSDVRRTLIKNSMYATIYSGGADTIAATAGADVYQVIPVLRELRKAFPSIADKGMSMVQRRKNGDVEIYTPTGRRFALPASQASNARVLPNYSVQGHSAEILKEAMVRLCAIGLEENLLLPVHDEILLSVKKTEIDDVAAEVKEVMDAVVDFEQYGVHVRATPVSGSSWGAVNK